MNLQDIMLDMRREMREAHVTQIEKLDNVIATQAGHETRLVVLENTRRAIYWLVGTVLSVFVGFLVSLFKH